MNTSAFVCPQSGNEFYEAAEPFLDNDVVACPWCKEMHVISGSFPRTSANLVGLLLAAWHEFHFHRSDRGAIEFVGSRRTGRRHWTAGDEMILAYAIGDCIYWPSISSSRNLKTLRHEMCHVRQSRRHGGLRFLVKYWIEDRMHGYERNRFEVNARRSERRRPRNPTRPHRGRPGRRQFT